MTRALVFATVLLALAAPISAAPRHRRGKRCARKSTLPPVPAATTAAPAAAPIGSSSAVAAASGSGVPQLPGAHTNSSLIANPVSKDPSPSGHVFAATPPPAVNSTSAVTNATNSTAAPSTSGNVTAVLPPSSTTAEPTLSASANATEVSSVANSTIVEPTGANSTIESTDANSTTSSNSTTVEPTANATTVALTTAEPTATGNTTANATSDAANSTSFVPTPTSNSSDVPSASGNATESSSTPTSSEVAPTGAQTGAPDQQGLLLDLHNTLRSQYSAPPVTWNESLAAHAADWAPHCTLQQSGGAPGENIAAGAGSYDLTALFDFWSAEQNNYDWSNPGMVGKDGNRVGHFTQAVWKDTTSIGCAWITSCAPNTVFQGYDSTILLVCEYWPHGNLVVPNNANWTQQWFEANVGPKV
ncbi:hypothetical protein VHUM_00704 [Vanrija humicola]|uniref:SCP domain-containing protein n=1 Tax=Vanrija humicola TaxID=5417 RepID=A0A7D8ZWI9_VANHU|nr:hypothetical protein VHUM_00704 [Vanrija humicola]